MARARPASAIDISLYRQVDAILRDRIADGELRPGDRLPAEEALRVEFGVSRSTLRQALDALERDGLLDRAPGRGTFVRRAAAERRPERLRLSGRALIDDAARADRLTRSGFAAPPDTVAQALGLSRGEQAPFFIRLGRDLGLKRYLHPRLGDELTRLAEASDFAAALGGAAPAKLWAEAILAEPRFAMQLNVPHGSPLLSIWWIDTVDGTAVACSQMLRPGAAVSLEVLAHGL